MAASSTVESPAVESSSQAAATERRYMIPYVIGVGGYHLLALAAFYPWLFSWTGVALAVAGLYVFGTLGINLCYHRLLTHRGFVCPKWLEHFLATLGVCCLQDTPARWVAIHRLHHAESDTPADPHSPHYPTFFWGHAGWVVTSNAQINSWAFYDKYARDILRDPFYRGLERNLAWVWINAAQMLLFYAAGFGQGFWLTGTASGGLQQGLSLLVWGVFVRTVAVWHITWSVNSLAHVWGYRNYPTRDDSRNNWFVALVSNGEGWHNNHHADQRSAAHGHRWWEFDITYLSIRALGLVGLARQIVEPRFKRRDAARGPQLLRDVPIDQGDESLSLAEEATSGPAQPAA